MRDETEHRKKIVKAPKRQRETKDCRDQRMVNSLLRGFRGVSDKFKNIFNVHAIETKLKTLLQSKKLYRKNFQRNLFMRLFYVGSAY